MLPFCFALYGGDLPAQEPRENTTSPVEVYVWGQQPTSAATEQTRWQKDLELRPSNTPSDVLRLTPGLIIGQHHGGGKADQISVLQRSDLGVLVQIATLVELFSISKRPGERRRHRTERQAVPCRQQPQLPQKLQSMGLADGNLGRFSEPLRPHPCRPIQSERPPAARYGQKQQY